MWTEFPSITNRERFRAIMRHIFVEPPFKRVWTRIHEWSDDAKNPKCQRVSVNATGRIASHDETGTGGKYVESVDCIRAVPVGSEIIANAIAKAVTKTKSVRSVNFKAWKATVGVG